MNFWFLFFTLCKNVNGLSLSLVYQHDYQVDHYYQETYQISLQHDMTSDWLF